MNTLGSRFRGVNWNKHEKDLQKTFLVTIRAGIQDSPNVLLKGESRLPGVFSASRFSCKPI
jgi:hypothetical protein